MKTSCLYRAVGYALILAAVALVTYAVYPHKRIDTPTLATPLNHAAIADDTLTLITPRSNAAKLAFADSFAGGPHIRVAQPWPDGRDAFLFVGQKVQLCALLKNRYTGEVVIETGKGSTKAQREKIAAACERAAQLFETERRG